MVFTVAAARVPALRYVNAALSAWLFTSTVFLQRASGLTLWNNVAVAAVLFAVSLASSRALSRRGGVRA
jgi:hypothetical protein